MYSKGEGVIMGNIKYVLFDCMETLVDMTELPSLREYAFWAFEGSGNEHFWESFHEFYESYSEVREQTTRNHAQYREFTMSHRFEQIARRKLGNGCDPEVNKAVQRFDSTYWSNYKSRCYVQEDIKAVLPVLAKSYRLGVISNFMIPDGIEELLEFTGIQGYFDFVITSVKEGWRKPHPILFKTAIQRSGVSPEEIIFVGDDIECDYYGARRVGINSCLLDRYRRYPEVDHRIESFNELIDILPV